ncbi:alpha/beta fold hydrolase [Chryseobacterium luquanense]|uniref:Alpha/beta hydrolase n=1 Tax=Chryseobacterium luquanense TaxID=2983766 RepID=A0ABT3Y4L1_9FLAO|nr:alpha/beta hydrolase [Chryseobacterium luquanense]MCX8533011.1 alpha/beta hydrolase [Chryseobacterium luquanense]
MIEEVIDVKGKNLFVKFNNSLKNKPTIVFLHDSLGSIQLWRDFPEKLAEATQCNVLLYDRLGYGKSFPMTTHERENNYMELEADVLNDLLSELNINETILFGHSDGGTIASIAAAKYSEKIKAVICEAGHIFVEEITIKGVKEAFNTYNTTNLPERLKKYHGDKVDMIVKAWTEIWLSEKFRTWNVEYLLKNITSPLLFIQGENDEYGSLNQVEKTVSQVGGDAEKFIIPNVGHTPHKDSPEIVLNKSIEFINSIISSI